MEQEIMYQKIGLPESLYGFIDPLYTDQERRMILESDESGVIRKKDYAPHELRKAYQKGVINKEITDDELNYKVADYVTHLECMIQYDKHAWDQLPEESLKAIEKVRMDPEHWLRERIENSYKGEITDEAVTPVEYVLEWLDKAEGLIVAHQCNCQAYERKCEIDKSNVCIHLAEGNRLNSTLDRGICKVLTKEEARLVILRADRDGLIHSLSPRGMCNCCKCCCYNFSNIDNYEVKDRLVMAPFRAVVEPEKCIGCKACQKICPFGALELKDGKMIVKTDICWGCGVCRTRCRQNAIYMYKL